MTLSNLEWRVIVVSVLLGFCGLLGVDIHLPSLPAIAQEMNITPHKVQQTVSMFLLGEAVSLLFYGPMADRYGRKPLVIIGLSIAVVSSFSAAFVNTIGLFLIMRFFQGVGSGVCLGLGRTVLADVLTRDKFISVGSYFSIFLSLSPLLAPVIGSYVQHHFGWHANFILLASILLTVLLMYACLCPETNTSDEIVDHPIKQIAQSYAQLLRNRVFIGCVFLSGVTISISMTLATLSPFLLQKQYHLSVIHYGWVMAVFGGFSFFGKIIFPHFIKRFSSRRNVLIGCFLIFFPSLMVVLISQFGFPPIVCVILLSGLVLVGPSFINSNIVTTALSPHKNTRGAAGALYGSFGLFVGFSTSAIVASLVFQPLRVLGFAFLIFGILAVIITLTMAFPKDKVV